MLCKKRSIPACFVTSSQPRVSFKMADRWRNFKDIIKEKRIGKNKGKKRDKCSGRIPDKDTIIVQRLSANVSGKAQKYARIGAREFVPYGFEEFTVENIQTACLKHFTVDDSMTCDVVAGEQGPSCTSVKQIPDFKVIHVRFVERADGSPETRTSGPGVKSPTPKRRAASVVECGTPDRAHPTKCAPSTSKFVPRSLSVVEMLKLGRTITQTTTSVDIYSFDLDQMAWSKAPSTIEFSIQKGHFGEGGFRRAYKATSKAKEFGGTWVIKRYLASSIEGIQKTGQTVEQHTKKVVQMHYLAKNFAGRLKKELQTSDTMDLFGKTLRYNRIYFGKLDSDECVTVEEFVEGTFEKYINNKGEICGDTSSPVCKTAECLAHYSYERSNKERVVDIQGCGHFMFDPEIASKELVKFSISGSQR